MYWSFAEQNVYIIHNIATRIVNELLSNRILKLSRTELLSRGAVYGLRTTELVEHCHSDIYMASMPIGAFRLHSFCPRLFLSSI